jgi:SNF2 family DNA or RNA helicase
VKIATSQVHGIPVFTLAATAKEPWRRVFGASDQLIKGAWAFPAYYPLGLWALNDLETVARHAAFELDPAARQLVAKIRATDAFYGQARAQFEARRGVDLPLPAGWKFHKFQPYQHQRFGVAIGLSWWRHLFLWEMGTGKTKTRVEAWRLRRARGDFRRGLVLCPAVVVPTWQREVATWSDGELTTYRWEASDPYKVERAAAADVVVVTYQTARIEEQAALEARTALRLDDERRRGRKVDQAPLTEAERARCLARMTNALAAVDYDDIDADESHSIGNYESQQTRAGLLLSVKAARRACLSGTAADEPLKLYPQLRFLAPGLMPMEYKKFLDAHVVFRPDNRHVAMYYKGLAGLNERVNMIASRMRKEDCIELPERTFVDIPFTLGIRQKNRYNELVKTLSATTKPLLHLALLDKDDSGDEIPTNESLSAAEIQVLLEAPHGAARLGKVMQVTSGFLNKGPDKTICDTCEHMHGCVQNNVKPYTRRCVVVQTAPPAELIRDFENPKILAFEDLLEQLLEGDATNKVLCWANHTTELDDMEAVLRRRGWGFVRIDGSTTHKIAAMEDRFQTQAECRVSLGIVSAGVGITLTAANFTVYYALPFNRVWYRQSLDRNHRPGQSRKITVYRLLGQGTVEPTIAGVLQRKELIAATLTDKIDCAVCPHAKKCEVAGIKPFREGCIYQPQVERPKAQVGEVL